MFPESLKRGGEEVDTPFFRDNVRLRLLAGRPSRSIKQVIQTIREDYSVDTFRTSSKRPRQSVIERYEVRARSCHLDDRRTRLFVVSSIGYQDKQSAATCDRALKTGQQNLHMVKDIQKFLDSLIRLAESQKRGEDCTKKTLDTVREELRSWAGTIEGYKREIAHCRMSSELLAESLKHSSALSQDFTKQLKFLREEVRDEDDKLLRVHNKLDQRKAEYEEAMRSTEILKARLNRLKAEQSETDSNPFSSNFQNKNVDDKSSNMGLKVGLERESTAANVNGSSCQDTDCEKNSKHALSKRLSKGICQTCISKGMRTSTGFSTFHMSDIDSKNLLSSKTFNHY